MFAKICILLQHNTCTCKYREFSDQVQSAITQLEQERLLAIKKAQRAQDELKKKQIVC